MAFDVVEYCGFLLKGKIGEEGWKILIGNLGKIILFGFIFVGKKWGRVCLLLFKCFLFNENYILNLSSY
jgi:hypothetical protein